MSRKTSTDTFINQKQTVVQQTAAMDWKCTAAACDVCHVLDEEEMHVQDLQQKFSLVEVQVCPTSEVILILIINY